MNEFVNNHAWTIADAQRDIRFGYLNGAPGVLASAIAWLVSGCVAAFISPVAGAVALFAGGMLIHPVGAVIAKMLGRPGTHTKRNPLGALAIEGTIWLLMCLPIAYVVAQYKLEWFFPVVLLIIGGRYFTFATLYGHRVYWILGGTLGAVAMILAITGAPAAGSAFAGGLVELCFACGLFVTAPGTKATGE